MNIKFQNSGIYRIVIQGGISQRWVNQFAEYIITQEQIGKDDFKTILKMKIMDQSHLSGVLNSLYDMHLTIIEIKMIESIHNINEVG